MDFDELIQQRRSCHHFLQDRTVTDDMILKIMTVVRLTPSGYNAQPWEFIVVRKRDRLKTLQIIAFDQPHVSQSGAMVVVLGDKNIGRHAKKIVREWVDYGYFEEEKMEVYLESMTRKRSDDKLKIMAIRNGALAAMTFIYAAQNLGLATCPMMGFSQTKLREFMKIPKDRTIVMMIALGYADTSKFLKRLPRKITENMLYREQFGLRFENINIEKPL